MPVPCPRYVRLLMVLALLASAVPLTAQAGARASLLGIDAALSDSVFKNGAPAIQGPLAEDGVLAWPGAGVVQGLPAARRLFARQPLLTAAKLSWQPFRVELSPDSSLGFTIGVMVIDRPAGDPFPAIHRIGRYLAVWKRVDRSWQLAAFAPVNVVAAGETIWNQLMGPDELPPLRSAGVDQAFVAADSASAADAGTMGIGKALEKWAAADAVTFAATGELNAGPARIGEVLAGNNAHWEWSAVAAGASADGVLGWTVGQAVVTPVGRGVAVRTKYLTLWRRSADGSVRFIARGSNPRP